MSASCRAKNTKKRAEVVARGMRSCVDLERVVQRRILGQRSVQSQAFYFRRPGEGDAPCRVVPRRLVCTRLFTLVVLGAPRVFLSALKPPKRVTDSNYVDHTATQHCVDRQSPHGPVPVPTSGPPRWARWRCDRSSSSQERIEASLHWKRLLAGSLPTCSQKLRHRPCSLRPWCSPAAHQR